MVITEALYREHHTILGFIVLLAIIKADEGALLWLMSAFEVGVAHLSLRDGCMMTTLGFTLFLGWYVEAESLSLRYDGV